MSYSTVRGHHFYKASWSPYIEEEPPVKREVNNIHDDFAVAVLKNSSILSVMYHGKFPESAGTSCTRVASGGTRGGVGERIGLLTHTFSALAPKQLTSLLTEFS